MKILKKTFTVINGKTQEGFTFEKLLEWLAIEWPIDLLERHSTNGINSEPVLPENE